MSGNTSAVTQPIPLQVPLSSLTDMYLTSDDGHAVLELDAPDLMVLFTACAHPAPTERDVVTAQALAQGAQMFADKVTQLADGVSGDDHHH